MLILLLLRMIFCKYVRKFRTVINYLGEEIVFGYIIGVNIVVNWFVKDNTALIANFCYNKLLIFAKN